jgi:imidazole glycerol-phosphate synthase subunit HisH
VSDVAVVDYGAGNVRSVLRALERAGVKARLAADPEVVAAAGRVVFPGVGALPDCMAALRRLGLDEAIRAHVKAGRPFLGICLGLQALFDHGEEQGGADGLGILPGRVVRFPHGARGPDGRPLKVPHMGWNAVTWTEAGRRHPVVSKLPDGAHFYFVHAYHPVPEERAHCAGTADHGGPFCAAAAHENVLAVQFHPEKSQAAGEALLARWLEAA